MANVQIGGYEWDSEKEKLNIDNHGFTFDDTAKALEDKNRYEIYDLDHSSMNEDRYIILCYLERASKVLVVIITDRGDRERIISAREAEDYERRVYNDSIQKQRRGK